MPRSEKENERIRQITKEKITNAAIELFATKGYAATNTSDIASLANISIGLMYRHFKSKEELFNNIAEYALAGLAGLIDLINSDGNPKLIIENIVNSVITELNNPQFIYLNMTIIQVIISNNEYLITNLLEKDHEMFVAMAQLIKRGQLENIFSQGDAMTKSIHLFTTIQGMVLMKFSLKDKYLIPSTKDVVAMLYN